jgi:hypothetical protein
MKSFKMVVGTAIFFVLSHAAFAAQPAMGSSDADIQNAQLRHVYCASQGGEDITSEGGLALGPGVASAVVCRFPATASIKPPSPAITLPPLAVIGATLLPPTGTATITAGNPIFSTSCAAEVFIKSVSGFPVTSHGTSTVSCRGFNSGSQSNGCNVTWSGATDVNVGVEPFGGQVTVGFTCFGTKVGSIATAMDYSYIDPIFSRIAFSASNVTGNISIVE